MNKGYFGMDNEYEPTEREEVKDFILELADYIAFNNRVFVCSTCLEVLNRLKDFMYTFYGVKGYDEITEVIEYEMEVEDDE